MTMATRPSSTGRKPLSPLRTRTRKILAYSPNESAMISGAARAASVAASSASAASGASGAGSRISVLTGAPFGRDGGEALGGTRGHQVDDGLGVVPLLGADRDHAAQAQHGHPVGDREH